MINERLKTLRKKLGLTQDEFSDSTNTKRTTYIGYEKGSYLPNSDFLFDLSTKYNVNINWLVNGTGKIFVENSTSEKLPLVNELEKTIDQHIEEKTEQRFESIEYQITLLKKQFETLNKSGECELCDPEPVYGEMVKIPFVENIAAGPPIEQNYTQGSEVEIPANLIHGSKEDFYAARISGDSMTESGIFNGEIILIKKSGEPVHGKIQVVRYMSKSTLKRVCKNGDLWELHFEDGTNRVIQVRENDYQIQGDFVSVIGKFVNFDK